MDYPNQKAYLAGKSAYTWDQLSTWRWANATCFPGRIVKRPCGMELRLIIHAVGDDPEERLAIQENS